MKCGRSIEVYPSFDYYMVDAGSLVGFNADLKFRSLRCVRGLETRYGRTHSYVEGGGLFHDGSSLQLLFGLNVTLYGSHFVEHQVGAQHAAPLLPTSQTSHKIV